MLLLWRNQTVTLITEAREREVGGAFASTKGQTLSVTLCPPVTTPLSDQTTAVSYVCVCVYLHVCVCPNALYVCASVYVNYAKNAVETIKSGMTPELPSVVNK